MADDSAQLIEHCFAEDPLNRWILNAACGPAMLRSAGFRP
jgi:hypothetical protein